MGKFAKQNEAQQLLGTCISKCGGEMEGRLSFLLGEVCSTVGSGKASAKAATIYGDINGLSQKSAEVIVAEH